jgi:integrase
LLRALISATFSRLHQRLESWLPVPKPQPQGLVGAGTFPGREQRELVAVNPTTGMQLPASRRGRDRIVDPAEAARLLAALPAAERALWATALYAGLRRGELMALRWQDVDLGRSEIRVERSWDQAAGPVEPKSEQSVRTLPLLAGAARPPRPAEAGHRPRRQ